MEIVLTKSAEFDAIVAEENEPNGADSADYNGVISYSLFPQYNLYIARLFVTGYQAIRPYAALIGSSAARGAAHHQDVPFLELDPIHMI